MIPWVNEPFLLEDYYDGVTIPSKGLPSNGLIGWFCRLALLVGVSLKVLLFEESLFFFFGPMIAGDEMFGY